MVGNVGAAVLSALKELFKMDEARRMVSVETLAVLTMMPLVLRFLLDFLGPWYGTLSVMMFVVPAMEAVNHSMVQYTLGLMQLSAVEKNDYFHVWAVLLVTLQYSVKVGKPYSRSMQTPLLDIMSSLWTANLLRVQTVLVLKIPLWLIWTLNAARIVSYFSSSDRADSINEESTWLVGDYMRYEHTLGAQDLDSKHLTMKSCKHLVHGEHHVLKDLQVQQEEEEHARSWFGVRLYPEAHEKLITLDKIWGMESGLC
jgi:hypothetical protein